MRPVHHLAPSRVSLHVQRSPLFCAPGLVKFVPAVARLFCLALPGSFLTMFVQNKGDPCRPTKPLRYALFHPEFNTNKMRSLIALTLVVSVSFAATINEDCKPRCLNDCLDWASGNVGSTNCPMMFGMGPEGEGWYWLEEGCDQTGKPKAAERSRTCQESCELICDNMCKPMEAVDDGEVAATVDGTTPSTFPSTVVAADRGFYRGYGRR